MTTISGLRADFADAIKEFAGICRFKYYTGSVSGDGYDDEQTFTQSGTDLWTSGIINKVSNDSQSDDAVLLQQGKIQITDKKLYLPHNIETSGIWKVGLGSPVTEEYTLTEGGVVFERPNGEIMFKTAYIKQLSTGSLVGE